MTLLLAMILLPLAGAVAVGLLRRNAPAAKGTALAVSLAEFALAVATWVAYDPA